MTALTVFVSENHEFLVWFDQITYVRMRNNTVTPEKMMNITGKSWMKSDSLGLRRFSTS